MTQNRNHNIMEDYSRSFCPHELNDCKDHSLGHRNTIELYKIGAGLAATSTWAEFGVGIGISSKKIAKLLDPDGLLYLFDSWLGLPEDWYLSPTYIERKGRFRFNKFKTDDKRIRFIDGWFEDVLPHDFGEQLGLVNIDCDLYSSTKTVLNGITDWVGSGTVFVFDELLGYRNYAEHEYKAVSEWLKHTGNNIQWLGKERFAAVGVLT